MTSDTVVVEVEVLLFVFALSALSLVMPLPLPPPLLLLIWVWVCESGKGGGGGGDGGKGMSCWKVEVGWEAAEERRRATSLLAWINCAYKYLHVYVRILVISSQCSGHNYDP